MTPVVVDASAVVAIAFNEPQAEDVAHRLQGAAVHAPTLLAYELANAAWKKAQRHPGQATAILQALASALASPIVWCSVDHQDVALLALTSGLTAYDASYVWLAGILGAALVTLDRRLVKAAAACE
jgi:predicted nucleic acid-binding protein